MKQILINLLSNAIKYNKEGEGRRGCSGKQPGRIRISVTDTGAGLPAGKAVATLPALQSARQESSSEEGTGIGLVVTKRLVELMEGASAWKASSARAACSGSSCRDVDYRRSCTEHGEARTSSDLAQPGRHPAATLLYVEDNPANMKLVEQLDRAPHGHAPAHGGNGTPASRSPAPRAGR